MQPSSTAPTGNRRTERGFGLPASTPHEVIRHAANAAQNAGFHSFWLNNPPQANALTILGELGRDTTRIWLGVGVIPLSHQSGQEIARGLQDNQLPLDRFYAGIGSGAGAGGVERVEEGIRAIRAAVDCTLVVAALGPRMCGLAGREADAVLLNWLTPDYAERSIAWVREGAESAGKPVPRLMAYVRGALGEEAIARLRREAASYEAIPQYAAHFQRMGTDGTGTAVWGTTAQELQAGLAVWDGIIDELVVRAVTAHDTADEVQEILEAVRPLT
jgi:alkanesulfonate monooxygenase SsuD/methylene tetrahydromethanopterin reductase-like flavin-dependent oxidoreductase (luciferase family)